MDNFERGAILYLAFDQIEQNRTRDIVEIFPDIFLEIILRAFGVCIDILADLHGAHMRPLAFLCRV